jgi:hypothetical protein
VDPGPEEKFRSRGPAVRNIHSVRLGEGGGTSASPDPEVTEVATVEQLVNAGDVVIVGRSASVQFAGRAGFTFRVVSVDARLTYAGWVWLDGYQLDNRGRAVSRRRIFVRQAGLGRVRTS